MNSSEIQIRFWRWGLGMGMILSALAIYDLIRLLTHIGIALFRSNWTVGLFAITLTFLASAGLFAATWSQRGQKLLASLSRFEVRVPLGRWIGWLGFAILIPLYTWITIFSPIRWQLLTNPSANYYVAGWEKDNYVFIDATSGLRTIGSIGPSIPSVWLHLWLFVLFAILVAGLLKALASFPFVRGLVLAFLGQTLVYKLALYIPEVSTFPFSLGWSEASRYYYASLMFSQKVYGQRVPLPIFHMTRYMLQSLPFLFGISSLAFHRFWQVSLWIGLTGSSSFVLTRRLRLKDRWIFLIFALWAFFFYLQGAVYYHLQVMVILVLAGFSVNKPVRTLIFVLLASLWAGISRVNWFPVPAMLAGLLYFLEMPIYGKHWFKYLIWPVIWFISGIVFALISQGVYIAFSGISDISSFGSSFTSDLLWYRLLPNPSFPDGVIPSVLIVAFSGLLALFWLLHRQMNRIHPLRWLGIIGYIFILLAGGLVVSTKIGGGGDLHNMDAFLVVFLVLLSYALFGEIHPESNTWRLTLPPWQVIALGLFVPLTFVLSRPLTIEPLNFQSAMGDLRTINRMATNKDQKGKEVLFITQRQLVTFGDIEVQLVPKYELLTLMEMSISNNEPYLDQFYADLSNHRFSMIVADKQFAVIKGENSAFSEENNAWVRKVSIPLLCDYRPVRTYDDLNVQVFVPRLQRDCPTPVLSDAGE